MNVPAPYGQILEVAVLVTVLSGIAFGLLAMGSHFHMWSQRTSKANFAIRLVPWWPWIDGMLTEDGVRSRKNLGRYLLGFVVCWLLTVAVLMTASAIWQR